MGMKFSMKKITKIVLGLLVIALLVSACSKEIAIDLSGPVVDMFGSKVTPEHLRSDEGKGFIRFEWKNLDSNKEMWSFNGSGLTIYAVQDDKEVGEIDITSPGAQERIRYNDTMEVILNFERVDESKPLIMRIKSIAAIDGLENNKDIVIDLETGSYTVNEIEE